MGVDGEMTGVVGEWEEVLYSSKRMQLESRTGMGIVSGHKGDP